MERKPLSPLELFYCYAHEDRPLRDELDKHLAGLRRSGAITTWYDGIISPGAVWKQEIETHLETAQIILLLISPDFLASDHCYSIAMTRAIARHQAKQTHVIPILVRPVDVAATPFSSLQLLPFNARPVTLWPNADDAFVDIARSIRSLVNNLRSSGHTPPQPPSPGFAPSTPMPRPTGHQTQQATPSFPEWPAGSAMTSYYNRPPMNPYLLPHNATPRSQSKHKLWVLAIIAALLLFVTTMSMSVWMRPTNHNTNGLPTASGQTSPSTQAAPTPSPSPPPVPPQPVTKHIHLTCVRGCEHDYFDATLNSYVVNQATGSITFTYTIGYHTTTTCADEAAYITLVDEQNTTTWAKSGSMFEGLSFAPGQTMQQTAVILLVPVSGSTYTLHTQIGCHFFSDQEKQAIPLTFS